MPHALVGKTVTVRLTAQAVEIYHRGQRAAAHLRSPLPGTFTTLAAHRPQRHQAIVDLSHEKLLHSGLPGQFASDLVADFVGMRTAAVSN